METKSDSRLGTEKILKLMLQLALPSVLAQIVNVLYNIIDRIYIGRIPGVGAAALTGVGVTFPVITIVSAFAGFANGGGAPLVGDHAAVLHGNKVIVGRRGDHHTDADVSIVRAGVDDIGALGNAAAGNHVLALHGQVVGLIGLGVCLDLGIGESLMTVGDILHAACGLGGVGDGGIAGVVVAFAVELGLDQINLDIAYGEGVCCALGVGEVGQRCAHNGDGYKSDTQEDRSNFLFQRTCSHLLPYTWQSNRI